MYISRRILFYVGFCFFTSSSSIHKPCKPASTNRAQRVRDVSEPIQIICICIYMYMYIYVYVYICICLYTHYTNIYTIYIYI